jgi:hypothetical protein
VGEQVTGEFFTDRSDEVERILRALREPTRLLVYGERRQGKSSAIRQACVRFEEAGGLALWVDVATASNFGEIARRLLAAVPYRWRWREALQERLLGSRLRIELHADVRGQPALGLLLEPRPMDGAHGREELRRSLEALDALAAEREAPVAVVLDEFQHVGGLVERGEWFLRDLIQTSHHLSYVCAGSRTALIRELVAPEGAFHRFFEPLALGPVDPTHLASWIESRMEGAGVRCEPGVGAAIIERVGPRTQDCLQLARAVYHHALAQDGAGTEDVEVALRQTVLEDGDRFGTLWRSFAPSQQAVLRALAAGADQLYAADTARRFGLPTSGTIRKAVLALGDRGWVAEGPSGPALDDPFFRQWIVLRAMPGGGYDPVSDA